MLTFILRNVNIWFDICKNLLELIILYNTVLEILTNLINLYFRKKHLRLKFTKIIHLEFNFYDGIYLSLIKKRKLFITNIYIYIYIYIYIVYLTLNVVLFLFDMGWGKFLIEWSLTIPADVRWKCQACPGGYVMSQQCELKSEKSRALNGLTGHFPLRLLIYLSS